jgi:hypothetical protein
VCALTNNEIALLRQVRGGHLYIKDPAIRIRDLIVIDLQEKDIIEDTTREDINGDINIKEVIAYLKRKNLCFSVDKYELGKDTSNKQERLKNILRLYKSF